jgi:hypothetical protein
MTGDDLTAAVNAYKAKFGDVPMLAGLPVRKLEHAIELLTAATGDGKAFTQSLWYAALELDEPPSGAVI